jgi:hypothetical protein
MIQSKKNTDSQTGAILTNPGSSFSGTSGIVRKYLGIGMGADSLSVPVTRLYLIKEFFRK